MATEKKTANGAEMFEKMTAFQPEAFKEGYEKFAKSMTDLADFQKESLEAAIKSASVITKGAEKATAETTAFTKEYFEEGVAAAKAASSSKSVQEVIDVQTDYARSAFEKSLGQFSKLADHWTAVTKEAYEPLTKRYGEFVEKVQAYRP